MSDPTRLCPCRACWIDGATPDGACPVCASAGHLPNLLADRVAGLPDPDVQRSEHDD